MLPSVKELRDLGLTDTQVADVLALHQEKHEAQRAVWREQKRNWRATVRKTSTRRPADIGIEKERTFLTAEPSLRKKESISAQIQFDRFWSAYPKRRGSNPKEPARKAFDRALKRIDADALIAAVKAYAAAELDHIDTPYVCQAVTWLNQARWEQYQPKSKSKLDWDYVRKVNAGLINGPIDGGHDATAQDTAVRSDTGMGQTGNGHAAQLRSASGSDDGPDGRANPLHPLAASDRRG